MNSFLCVRRRLWGPDITLSLLVGHRHIVFETAPCLWDVAKVQRGATSEGCSSLPEIFPVSGRKRIPSLQTSQIARHRLSLAMPIVNSEILLTEPRLVARSPCGTHNRHRRHSTEDEIAPVLLDGQASPNAAYNVKGEYHLPVNILEWVAVGQSEGAFPPALL